MPTSGLPAHGHECNELSRLQLAVQLSRFPALMSGIRTTETLDIHPEPKTEQWKQPQSISTHLLACMLILAPGTRILVALTIDSRLTEEALRFGMSLKGFCSNACKSTKERPAEPGA